MIDNSPRKKAIRKALIELRGMATTKEIAQKAGLSIGHGITQTLNNMENIECLNKTTHIKTWQIKPKITIIKHACYSQETLFDIVQNDYIGSSTGYLEILTINDPPIGKHQFIVHNALNYAQNGRFVELNSLDEAIKIFEIAKSCIYPDWYKSPEVITCSIYNDPKTPWFYSKTKNIPENIYTVTD